MSKQREGALVAKIKKELNTHEEAFFFKVHGGPMQMAGISDLIGIYKGRFIAIEVKTPDNKKGTTKLQDWFIDQVNKCGGLGFVARSMSDVSDKLQLHDNV